MPRTPLQISLPGHFREYVEARVVADGYRDPSDYLGELVRRDRLSRAKADLDRLLREGLSSGEGIQVTPESMDALEREVAEIISRTSSAAE